MPAGRKSPFRWANPRRRVSWLGGDVAHRFGRSAEQDGVDRALVLERDLRLRRRQGEDDMVVWQGEDDMVVGYRQQLGLTCLEPLGARQTRALRTMSVSAGNGRCPLPALWANLVMGSWRRLDRALVSAAANSAHHYEGRWRSAISLSDGWNAPRRRCGGTIDSMASSFSVGSPRV